MPRLRILIAEDHDLIRKALRSFLENQPEWEVVGEARNGREAVQKALELQPQVAVLDIGMPELNGLDAAREILCVLPKTELIVLTTYEDPELRFEAGQLGVSSYVMKAHLAYDLVPALQAASARIAFECIGDPAVPAA